VGVNLLAEMAGVLREYVTQANVRACIVRKLKSFFLNFRAPDSREYRYQKRIQDLVAGEHARTAEGSLVYGVYTDSLACLLAHLGS
jgi:hypothetical protein